MVVPGERRKRVGGNLSIEVRPDVNRISDECATSDLRVMPQIPGLGADRDVRENSVGEGAGYTERCLIFGDASCVSVRSDS